jgi:hypothetical protein
MLFHGFPPAGDELVDTWRHFEVRKAIHWSETDHFLDFHRDSWLPTGPPKAAATPISQTQRVWNFKDSKGTRNLCSLIMPPMYLPLSVSQ